MAHVAGRARGWIRMPMDGASPSPWIRQSPLPLPLRNSSISSFEVRSPTLKRSFLRGRTSETGIDIGSGESPGPLGPDVARTSIPYPRPERVRAFPGRRVSSAR